MDTKEIKEFRNIWSNPKRFDTKNKTMTKTIKELQTDIECFENYCNKFYNIKSGIYPLATKQEIKNAIQLYFLTNDFTNIEFDSLDREKVRLILNK